MAPDEACRDLWPLAQAGKREISGGTAEQREWLEQARGDDDYGPVLAKWEQGEGLVDADYERVRARTVNHRGSGDPVGVYVLTELLRSRLNRFRADNALYYGLKMDVDPCLNAYLGAFRAALVTTTPEHIAMDTSPVPQKFERLFFDTMTHAFWGLGIRQFANMPSKPRRNWEAGGGANGRHCPVVWHVASRIFCRLSGRIPWCWV